MPNTDNDAPELDPPDPERVYLNYLERAAKPVFAGRRYARMTFCITT
jgi:hypothetical protein